MSRKTFNVEEVRIMINEILAVSTCSPDIRKGQMNVLEHVLHSTGNYRGYAYLTADQVPSGQLPGINWGHVGDYEASFFNTDNTRVVYF